MVNVNDTPTMIVPAPCCLSICIPHSLSSGTLHICQLRHLHRPETLPAGGCLEILPRGWHDEGSFVSAGTSGDWKIRCDDDGDVWAGTRRPDGNGWSLLAIRASHWCACVCAVQCCNIIAMSLYCKDDKCYYSAASLHHSAAALVICFHCDAREQLQK